MTQVALALGSFLSRLDPEHQEHLVAAGRSRHFAANTVLLHQGDVSTHVIVIRTGWVKITNSTPSGYDALLAIRGPGDMIGELAAMDGKPRSATVRTLMPTSTVMLTAEALHRCLEERPLLSTVLFAYVADHLRRADNRRLELSAHSVHERLARYLLQLADQHGVPCADGRLIDIQLSQQDLAGAIGASREAVARILRIFRDRRVVLTRRRRLVVCLPEVLRSMIGNVHIDTEEPC